MSTLTWVFCLVRAARRPSLRDAPPPVPGGDAVALLDAGQGLWAAVTHVPAREYDADAVVRGLSNLDWVAARAMAHEAVVEHFLGAAALLPMQLFTLFTSDDRVLAHLARDRRRIDRVLARIDRQVEWGLRLTFDDRASAGAGAGGRRSTGKRPPESGAAYLTRKRDAVRASQAGLAQARAESNRLYRALAREATASRRHLATEQAAPGSRVLVDAAFLVPVRRTAAFRTALRQQARVLSAPGVVVSLTGPWPPYNFVTSGPRHTS